MSKFNWWRRSKKKKPLQKNKSFKGKSFLLQQIEHGDYDYSDYYKQAQLELMYCKEEQRKVASTWKAFDDSLKEELSKIEKKYRKRYNKLMEDHLVEEQRILSKIKKGLIKEFKIDVWEESLESARDLDLLDFYYKYKQLAKDYYAQKS